MKVEPETAFDDVIQDIPKTEMKTTIQEETKDHEIESKIQVSFPHEIRIDISTGRSSCGLLVKSLAYRTERQWFEPSPRQMLLS